MIQKYTPASPSTREEHMRESDEGAWVRFADHEKVLNQAMNSANDQKQTDSRPLIESLENMLRLIESGWFLRAHDPQGYSSESATITKARNALTKAKKESPQPVDL